MTIMLKHKFYLNEDSNPTTTNNNSNNSNKISIENEMNKLSINSNSKKQLNDQLNANSLHNTFISDDFNNTNIISDSLLFDNKTITTTNSYLLTNMSLSKKDYNNKKSLWSKIALKFRFVQHFMKRAREREKQQQLRHTTPPSTSKEIQFNLSLSTNPSSSTSRSDLKSTGSIKYVDSRNLNYLERTLSSRSYCNDIRSRMKSDSDKDSCSCTDDASNDYTTSLFEINSNVQLNNPNSIKCANNKFNDYLFLVNSDNETIDLFNKNDKSLTTFIDTTLSNTSHSVRTPVDLITNNSNLFISDWLNDEILVYNYDGQLQNVISNNNATGMKYFSAPWGISIDAVNDYLYVCNTAKNSIEIFDSRLQYYQTLGKQTVTTTSITTNTSSSSSSFNKHNSKKSSNLEFHTPKWLINCDHWGFAVSDWDSNEIKLIDRNSNQLIRTIRDCYNPEGLTLLERTGTQLLVLSSYHKNILKMFDILSGKLIKTYDLFSSNDLHYQKYEQNNLCSIYGLRGLCYSNEKIYFTDSIKNKIFICNL